MQSVTQLRVYARYARFPAGGVGVDGGQTAGAGVFWRERSVGFDVVRGGTWTGRVLRHSRKHGKGRGAVFRGEDLGGAFAIGEMETSFLGRAWSCRV